MSQKHKLILRHRRSPGDIVCMTALVRDVALQYPGIVLNVNSTCGELWQNNPYLSTEKLWNGNHENPKILVPGAKMISCDYGRGLKDQNTETVHFVSYFHRDFTLKTGLPVSLTLPHGDLHLSDREENTRPLNGRYWVLINGGKSDFTIKVWHKNDFQEVVNQLLEQGIQCVQIGDNQKDHWQPTLQNTLDLRGRVPMRGMLQFIRHADGVICGVTAAMHMAAALGRPCVCIAGGREAWWWEAYVRENKGLGGKDVAAKLPVPHRFLHTIGLLDCCQHHGCWKNKVVPINSDALLCKQPVYTDEMAVAKCMAMIKPSHVVGAVMSYYSDGTLPPITEIPTIGDEHKVLTTTNKTVTLSVADELALRPLDKSTLVARELPVATIPAKPAAGVASFNHERVGGKFTIFVLMYGGEEFFAMHKICLESILKTVPRINRDIRVGSNQLNARSAAMVSSYVASGDVSKHYRHETNDFKYPVMREMFFDESHPIKTKWIVWFDDDSICNIDQNWLVKAATTIIGEKDNSVGMLGARLTWSLTKQQAEIFKRQGWHKGRDWQSRSGMPAPGGSHVVFGHGGFWLLKSEAIVKCDIPDLGTGLTHNGGDWQIGAQLYQNQYSIRQFNGNKSIVNTSSVPRRGVTKPLIDKIPQKPAVKEHKPESAPAETQPQQAILSTVENSTRKPKLIRL